MSEDIIELPEEMTLGEKRVLVVYKDDQALLNKIEKIRNLSSELIDLLEDDFKKHAEFDPEIKRVYANAQTEIEGSCMWAIKAICK